MPFSLIFLGALLAMLLVALVVYYLKLLTKPQQLNNITKEINAGNYESAITKLQAVIKKNNFDYAAHKMLALAYTKAGKYKMAIVEYTYAEKNIENEPAAYEIDIRRNLANLHDLLGEKKEALEEYLLLIKMDPKADDAFANIGRIFFEMNNFEKAAQYLRMSIKLNPQNAQALYMLGKSLFETSSYVEALQEFTNCIKYEPKKYECHYYIGLCYKHLQDFGKAIEFLNIGERSKDMQIQAILNKGMCYLQMDNNAKVIDELSRGVKICKQKGNVLDTMRYILADAYEKRKDITNAIELWEAIQKDTPKFKDVSEKLGQYNEVRQSDVLKDFMCAPITRFQEIAQSIIEKLELQVNDITVISNEEIVGTARESTKMIGKTLLKYIKYTRYNEPITYDQIRVCIDDMKRLNCNITLFFSTSGFSSQARSFASTRPFELYDSSGITELFKR